jgi:hypothetical protein
MPNAQEIAQLNIQTPSDQDFAAQAARQQRQMGGSYDQVFSSAAHGEAVRRLHQKRNEEQRRLARMAWGPASIVNLMPFPLNVNGVLHARLAEAGGDQVPACPVGTEYVQKIISDPQWSIRDEGAGMDNVDNYTPIPWVPMELAEDYAIEFLDRMGCGGVVIYEGVEKPKREALEKARLARNRWLLRKVHEAEADWADTSGRGRKNITEMHRKAAEILLHENILKHQPAWLLVTNTDAPAAVPCPGCGNVTDPKAVICKDCRYVFKPLEAYKATMIEYGHIAMDRLTVAEWNTATTLKNEREKNRAEAKGKKALS